MNKRNKSGIGTRFDDPVVKAWMEGNKNKPALNVGKPDAGRFSTCNFCHQRKTTTGANRKSGRFVCADCLGVSK